jgi:AraC-like DNA-binding protein
MRLPTVSLPRTLGIASNPPAATFGPRVMGDYEFVWMIEGTARYHWVGQSFDLPEGSVVLCRPTIGRGTDAFDWDPVRRSRHAFTHFDVRDPLDEFPPQADWPFVRQGHDADIWRPLFRHARSLHATPASSARDAVLASTMRQLLAVFVLGLADAGPLPEPALPEPVARAARHFRSKLEADPSTSVTLDELADAACVTRAYLCRAFKSATGTTPLEAVRRARLDRALSLLTRSNEPVAAVAGQCGFRSGFHFSRRFKETFGVSPTRVRQAVRRGEPLPLPANHLRLTAQGQQRA